MNWWKKIISDGVAQSAHAQSLDQYSKAEADLFIRSVGVRPTDRILDFGCGEGGLSIALVESGFTNVSAVDPSNHFLTAARQNATRHRLNVSFLKAEQFNSSFANGQFDAVAMLGNSFARPNSFGDDATILREALRLLRPSGTLMLSVADGDWRRKHFRNDTVEILAEGFIYRTTVLSGDTRRLITHDTVVEREKGISTERTSVEQLYGSAEITELLSDVGFEAISFCWRAPVLSPDSKPARSTCPRLYVTCRTPPARPVLSPSFATPKLSNLDPAARAL